MSQKLYTVYDASFNAQAITGIVSQDCSDGGDVNQFFSDGDVYSQFGWMENIAPAANITTVDLSLAADANFNPGDQGVLIQWFPQRAAGQAGLASGAVALKALWTAQTMLGRVAPSASQAGQSKLVLPFTGLDDDGTTVPMAFSLADHSA